MDMSPIFIQAVRQIFLNLNIVHDSTFHVVALVHIFIWHSCRRFAWISLINNGSIFRKSPTTARSATSKIAAFSSLL
ncbi:MAG: transposase, partial [Deltaproteobacteria bacterium]|nr:transposase [Deltaproteobacteria bacterium]